MIPNGWKTSQIKDLAKINISSLPENTDPNYRFKYLDLSSIKSGKIEFPIELTTFKKAPSRARRILNKGDVIMASVRPYLKGFAYADFDVEDIVCSTGFAVITPDRYSDGPFIYQCLYSHSISRQLYGLIVGSNYPAINASDVKNLKLTIPQSETERAKIAAILSTWDKAIEQMQKLIDAKTRLKKGLMQQLLTGKRRFKEFIVSDRNIKSRYFQYPEDWTYLSIARFAKEVKSRNNNSNKVPVLSCTKYNGLVDSLEYFGKQVFSEDTSNYKVVKRNQFAYATNHIEEGSIGLLDHIDQGMVSPMYTVFKTDAAANPQFLYKLFKTELYRHIFDVSTNASVNRRGSLRWNQFSKIMVALPSLDEQNTINAVISNCDEDIVLLQNYLQNLQNQKKGLMQVLLAGKVRVKC